jgi:hypothetical protein
LGENSGNPVVIFFSDEIVQPRGGLAENRIQRSGCAVLGVNMKSRGLRRRGLSVQQPEERRNKNRAGALAEAD